MGATSDCPRAKSDAASPDCSNLRALPRAATPGYRRCRAHEAAADAGTRLINDPDLIFLDEPTTGLDPQARHLIWERLRNLMNQGKTLFLTTHFMDEAERLCNRLAIMDCGRIVACGAPRELIAQHIEPQVVEVFGEGAERWAETFGRQASERCEKTGETIFCYTHDADPIVHHLDGQHGLRYLHRPANLEDVFLKLTGRELRD